VTKHLAPHPPGPLEPGPAPEISVIIAAYQAADTVGEAIESALTQTRPPHEIVVCDDGSTDDLERAVDPYRERIVFLTKPHGGEGSAKNAAARAATGEFVAILDADDVYLPGRLEALAELSSERPDLDILTTDAYLEAEGEVVRRAYDETWAFEVADQRRAILERNFVFGHAAVRRSMLLGAQGFDESIRWTTDWECWLRLIFAGSRAGLVDEPLSRYRLHERALSSRRAAMLRGRVMTLEKASAHAMDLGLTSGERETLARSIALHRRLAAVEEAREALHGEDPTARRRALAIATGRGYSMPTRLKAAAAGLSPGLARRLMLRRRRHEWVGAAGIRVNALEPPPR
jgi:glycosyltransferase involved in cell wall biosynthesis